MRFQSTQASCGPAALRTALLCHGVARSEDELATLAGFKPADGTSPRGLLKALHTIAAEQPGVSPGLIRETREDVAMLKLWASLHSGSVVIVCLDEYEHWGTVIGALGKGRFHLYDPAHEEMVLHLTPPELAARWRGPGKKPFYGIVI